MNFNFTLKGTSQATALLLLLCGQGLVAGEGPVSAVQGALIREQFLAGEPSGVLDESTHAALRQFQTRHSLPVTGEIDSATLQALQGSLADRVQGSARAQLPESVVASDHEFLRNLEVAKQSGAVASDAPAATAGAYGGAVPGAKVSVPVASTSRPEASKREETKAELSPPVPKAKPRAPVVAANDRPPVQKRADSEANGPAPASRNQTVSGAVVDNDNDSDLRSTTRVTVTRTKGPDGRTYVSEKRITTYGGAEPPPETEEGGRSGANGFFHRLFRHD